MDNATPGRRRTSVAVMLAAVAVVLNACSSNSSADTTVNVPTLSTFSGSSNAPNVSPAAAADGTHTRSAATGQIVFYNDPLNSDPKQLYLENADGTGRHQLVHSTDDDVEPTISPDGTKVVFTRMRNHGELPDQIFIVGADGQGLHQIIPGGCPLTCGDAVEGHAFSPDGKRLVFTRAVFPDPNAAPAYIELWTADLDGTHAVRLTRETGTAQDDDASWSPDGRSVVFLHWVYGSPDEFGIATININGSGMRVVTPKGVDAADPSYSPRGDSILFQSPPDPHSGANQVLYTVRPDGSDLRLLTKDLTGVAANHPSWSPDGRQILFCHIPLGQDHGADLYVIDSDGTHLHPLAFTVLNENGAYWGHARPH